MPLAAPQAHPLRTYAQHLGIEAPRPASQARLDLRVDDRHRLRLLALPDGSVMIRARLMPLPQGANERDALAARIGRLACGMMKHHASTCVIDPQARSLWLQQTTAGTSAHDIDDAVGQFVNALAFWAQATATPLLK